MRILCTNQALESRGGAESYLETIIDELLKLGHDVVAFGFLLGPFAERLARLGCEVHDDVTRVGPVDVIHAQHASGALAARAEFPDTPLVFACHSWVLDIEDPPAATAPAALLAFNDPVAARLRASTLGEHVPIHRLRQPLSMDVIEPNRIPIDERPRIAVAMARNFPTPTRLGWLETACERADTHLEIYSPTEPLDDPTSAMMGADVVFCTGRTALEAMGLGRAAFIYGESGTGSFVTADRYQAFEANGFTPTLGGPAGVDSIVEELGRYNRELGPLGRELVGRYHIARTHVVELVNLYRSVMEKAPTSRIEKDAAASMAVLAQRNFDLAQRARWADWERARMQRELTRVQNELSNVWGTASWRLTRPLRALGRAFRRST